MPRRPNTKQEILSCLLGGNPGEEIKTSTTTYVLPEGGPEWGVGLVAILRKYPADPDWFTPDPPVVGARITWRNLAKLREYIRQVDYEPRADRIADLTVELDETLYGLLEKLNEIAARCRELDSEEAPELKTTVNILRHHLGHPEITGYLQARLDVEQLGPSPQFGNRITTPGPMHGVEEYIETDDVDAPARKRVRNDIRLIRTEHLVEYSRPHSGGQRPRATKVAHAASFFFDVPVTPKDLAYVAALEPDVDFGGGSGYLGGTSKDKDAAEDYWKGRLAAVRKASLPHSSVEE